jgi:hypothetical protein
MKSDGRKIWHIFPVGSNGYNCLLDRFLSRYPGIMTYTTCLPIFSSAFFFSYLPLLTFQFPERYMFSLKIEEE